MASLAWLIIPAWMAFALLAVNRANHAAKARVLKAYSVMRKQRFKEGAREMFVCIPPGEITVAITFLYCFPTPNSNSLLLYFLSVFCGKLS